MLQMKQLIVGILCACSFTVPSGASQSYKKAVSDCRVELKNDTLTIENNRIRRRWIWNKGHLITCRLEDKKNALAWRVANRQPDLVLPKEAKDAGEASIRAEEVKASMPYTHHLRATVEYRLGQLWVRRIFKVYPDCPAIACELYLKGKASRKWVKTFDNPADL